MRLELTSPNKERFLLVPEDENGKPVWVDRDHQGAHEGLVGMGRSLLGRTSWVAPMFGS